MARSSPGTGWWLLAGLLLASGCQKAGTPEGAYLAFAEASERGDAAAAFGALSTPAQNELRARAEAASKASGGSIKADPAALVFTFTGRPSGISNARTLSVEGDRAVVEVTANGSTARVPMVREQAGWKVDLPLGGQK